MRRITLYPSKRQQILPFLMMTVLSSLDSPPTANTENPTPAVYSSAPNFSRVDLDQRNVDLTTYRGKVVVLDFWASWCAPCLTEMPRFVEWQQEYGGRGLQVIGISMDDEAPPVRAAFQKYRLNFPVVMGDEKLGEMYGGILGLPITFLIDRNGKIRFKHQGVTDLNIIESAQRASPLEVVMLSTLIRQPDRRPQLLFPLLHSPLAHYQTFRCSLTADVVRRRFLSAIPELFWATARNKASTIFS
jgi:cytochrome c biogenesis protein CcmG/thiol:disulfide interchange protein DsbE